MTLFEPSEFQKEIMRNLWAMRDNLGHNVIQFAQRQRMRSKVDREMVLTMPFDFPGVSQEDLDVDSPQIAELFKFKYIEDIPDQNEMFKRIGINGETWCQANIPQQQTTEKGEND